MERTIKYSSYLAKSQYQWIFKVADYESDFSRISRKIMLDSVQIEFIITIFIL